LAIPEWLGGVRDITVVERGKGLQVQNGWEEKWSVVPEWFGGEGTHGSKMVGRERSSRIQKG
jgi:hypothetical protein